MVEKIKESHGAKEKKARRLILKVLGNGPP